MQFRQRESPNRNERPIAPSVHATAISGLLICRTRISSKLSAQANVRRAWTGASTNLPTPPRRLAIQQLSEMITQEHNKPHTVDFRARLLQDEEDLILREGLDIPSNPPAKPTPAPWQIDPRPPPPAHTRHAAPRRAPQPPALTIPYLSGKIPACSPISVRKRKALPCWPANQRMDPGLVSTPNSHVETRPGASLWRGRGSGCAVAASRGRAEERGGCASSLFAWCRGVL